MKSKGIYPGIISACRSTGWVAMSLGLFCLFAFSGTAYAQGFGSIVGNVTDPSGSVIVNARVTVTERGTGFARTAVTDAEGHYVLTSLRPAQYDLSIEAAGFRTFSQKGLTLLADQALTVNVTAQVGTKEEVVNVTGDAIQVDTSTPTLKQVIEKERLTELPLNGRNAATLTLTAPGAVTAPSGGADQGTTKTFPGFYTWDMAFTKNFPFTERISLQFRAEFFNIFNRVNFDETTATGNFAKLSSKGNFGALQQAADPRIGQLALKLFF
jgi:hypothetical protein